MQIAWTKHLSDPEDVKRFESSILSAKPVLQHLSNLYEQKSKALDKARLSRESFKSPNWAEEQAYVCGYRACLEDNKTLLNLDPKDK